MKKRLLSALLALALVFVLLPTTALAEVTTGKDYDISINGKGWKFEKDTPVYFYSTAMPTMRIPTGKFASVVLPHLMQTTNLIRLPVLVPVVLPSLVAIPPRMSPLLLPAWLV